MKSWLARTLEDLLSGQLAFAARPPSRTQLVLLPLSLMDPMLLQGPRKHLPPRHEDIQTDRPSGRTSIRFCCSLEKNRLRLGRRTSLSYYKVVLSFPSFHNTRPSTVGASAEEPRTKESIRFYTFSIPQAAESPLIS